MKAIGPASGERQELLAELERMPGWLAAVFAGLSAAEAATAAPDGGFPPVSHCWHLADLEREGFAVRIRRLLAEPEPQLPDFDGARLARERRYELRSLAEGIAEFRRARLANLAALRAVRIEDWTRAGQQEGVGRVALGDLPSRMAEHDAAHRREIEAWSAARPR